MKPISEIVIEKTVKVNRNTGKILVVSIKQSERSSDEFLDTLVKCVSESIKKGRNRK